MAEEIRQATTSFHKLRKAGKTTDEGLAFRCMSENVTYRLTKAEASDFLIGVRLFIRMLRLMRSGGQTHKILEGTSGNAILECNFVYEELEQQYVEKQSSESPSYFISKEDLPRAMSTTREMLHYSWFAIWHLIRNVFAKNRGNVAMQLVFVAECAALLKLCKQLKIKNMYDFAPYLIDSNWAYLLCRDSIANYCKLPSPGPLYTHNHTLLCDTLILSNHYQFEEIARYSNVKFKEVEKWLPEYAFTYIDRYLSHPATREKTIGYYSHGGWLRAHEQHADDGLNIPHAEHILLQHLAQFVAANPDFSVIVFPHPRERKEEIWERTLAHYSSYFESEQQFKIIEKDIRTAYSFEKVDIAMAAFSTILYERLFCGYKTLIGNYGIPNFPMEGSSLNAICFDSYDQLQQLILHAAGMSNNTFFESFGLIDYKFDHYPYFSDHDRNS
jgi:hypothetical protein